ncbi:SNARE-associated protein Snapin [Meleagris gallopavo]|nr:SNARE-associated protein Snapin [Meleagris gallopavo]
MKTKLKSSEQYSCLLIIKADNFTQNKAESKRFGWNGHDRIMETHLNSKGKAKAAMKNKVSGKAILFSITCSTNKRGLYGDKEISSDMMQSTGPGGWRWGCAGAAGLCHGLSAACRESQVELREHIDSLATELCRINEDQKVALDLDPYVKKLLNARRRVVLVNNILQNAQERLRRLNHSVAKETMRRRAMLEAAGGYPQGLPSK